MRARNIKPGFFKNEELAELGPYAEKLFLGLWCLADREGRLEDRPKRIRAEIFPYYDPKPSIEKLLDQLVSSAFVKRYTVGEVKIIQILNFHKHQRPHVSEKPSILPSDVETTLVNVENTLDAVGNLPDSLIPDSLIPDSLIPDSPKPEKSKIPYQDLINLWNREAPKELPRAKGLNDNRKKVMRAGWEGFPDLEHWARVFRHLATNPHRMGFNDRGWKASIDFVFREWLKLSEELPEVSSTRPRYRLEDIPPELLKPEQVTGDPNCQECGGKGFLAFERFGVTMRRVCDCYREVGVVNG